MRDVFLEALFLAANAAELVAGPLLPPATADCWPCLSLRSPAIGLGDREQSDPPRASLDFLIAGFRPTWSL